MEMDISKRELYFYGMVQERRFGIEVEVQPIASALSASEWDFSIARHGATARAFVLAAGTGVYAVDGAVYSLEGPCVLWLPAGHLGSVRLEAGARGVTMTVADAALGRVIAATSVAGSLREAIDRPLLGIRIEAGAMRALIKDFEEIQREADVDLAGRREAILNRLSLILIAIWRLGTSSVKLPQASPRILVQGFLHLVEMHARQHWTIEAYARTLGITTDRLTTAVRRATGQSPLETIHRRLIEDAETLLEHSNLQVAEISDTLGFKDAGYFNRFFSRIKGLSPGRFRRNVIENKGLAEVSYSAWP